MAPVRRGRTGDGDSPDHLSAGLAEPGAQSGQDLPLEQPQLRRPGRGLGHDVQGAVPQAGWRAVVGDVSSYELGPPGDHVRSGGLRAPPLFLDHLAEQDAEGDRTPLSALRR
jgi:hypothetical protein